MADPVLFSDGAGFRRWLETHHASATELLVRLPMKGSSLRGMGYAAALDEALAFGWIDGVRKGLDSDSYSIRFTPRKRGSIWSNVNVRHVERLKKEGKMAPAGIAAFEARKPARTGIYSFERARASLSPDQRRLFEAKKTAWAFFLEQAPSYQRTATHWVVSAKKAETSARRLDQLIASSAAKRRLPQFS